MLVRIILYLIFTVSGLTLFKLGSSGTSILLKGSNITVNLNFLTVLGLIFYVLSFFIWLVIIKSEQLSYIIPLSSGLVYVSIAASSALFLNERITLYKGIGIVVILIGMVLINLNK